MTKTETQIIQKIIVIKQLIEEKEDLLNEIMNIKQRNELKLERTSLIRRLDALTEIAVTYRELQDKVVAYAKVYNKPFTESFITELIDTAREYTYEFELEAIRDEAKEKLFEVGPGYVEDQGSKRLGIEKYNKERYGEDE